jgi:hypothetical protein
MKKKHEHCYHETCKGNVEKCNHTFKGVNKKCINPYKTCCICHNERQIWNKGKRA